MKVNQTAIYLTCTKKRSLQKKHIDVCRRCPSNGDCREFQENQHLAPIPTLHTSKYTEDYLPNITKHLIEIRKLVGDDGPTPSLKNPADTEFVARASLPQYLKVELEGIKSLCSKSSFK